jgi:hypothetical protein
MRGEGYDEVQLQLIRKPKQKLQQLTASHHWSYLEDSVEPVIA